VVTGIVALSIAATWSCSVRIDAAVTGIDVDAGSPEQPGPRQGCTGPPESLGFDSGQGLSR
jgi:hypothetical protein